MRKTLRKDIETRRISKDLDNLISNIDKFLYLYKKEEDWESEDYTEREIVECFIRHLSKKVDWVVNTLNFLEQSIDDFTETYLSLVTNKYILIPVPSEKMEDKFFIKITRK